MSIMQIKPRDPQENLQEQGSTSKSGAPAVDVMFAAFMQQLLGTIMQAPLPANDIAGKAACSGTGIQGASGEAMPAPTVNQQVDAAPASLLGFQEPPAADDAPVAAFRGSINAVQDREDRTIPAAGTAVPDASSEPDRTNTADYTGKSGQAELLHQGKTDYWMTEGAGGDGVNGAAESGEHAPRNDGAEPLPPKTDFAGIMMHEHASSRLHDGHAASQRVVDTSAGYGPLQPRRGEHAELFDTTATIIKEGNRLAVKLEPEGLGKLDINISLEKGLVNTQIQVSETATKTLLENNMQQLVNSLTSEGLSVGGFSIAMDHGAAGSGTSDIEREGGREPGSTDPLAAAAAGVQAAQGLVSIFV